MSNSTCSLFSFLKAARGNWRNSIFIKCSFCSYNIELCSGFLYVPDADANPILLKAELINVITGSPVDETECQMILSRQRFETLFSLWLDWNTSSSEQCALLQIVEQNSCIKCTFACEKSSSSNV